MVMNQGNYKDKDKFYERLHKEGEIKDQYMRGLKILKEHSEVNQCTFRPETNLSSAIKENINNNKNY